MKLRSLILSLLVLISSFILEEVVAQTNSSFQVATRLIQQQRYDDALPILTSLHRQDPQVFVFLDRLVECHIQLKEYNTAKSLLESSIANGFNVGSTNILLGELYHLEGDTARAFEIWDSNLVLFPNQTQLYYNTANMMTERREFDRAIEVFLKGREVFQNDVLFLMDVPNVYMQAGRYQEAISEWLLIIEQIPEQANVFRRNLIRYNDPLLFEDSIAEIEFKLREMNVSDANYDTFFDLQNWLLFENNLFRRAFSAAMRYERATVDFNYKLDLVGRQLVENNQFELALDAFAFYRDNARTDVKMMAYEKMADVNARWAKYLEDYNLGSKNQIRQLYTESIAILDTLIDDYNYYRRIDQIYLRKAELSLDQVYDLEEAKRAVELFKMIPNKSGTAQAHYLDGRLYLAESEYKLARIELTRSNRLAGTGQLAEKTRYFLALTDFYAGDFEFAKIQLKTLGRRNTSFYANDALKLRLWLQEGTTIDTTGIEMTLFAAGIKELKTNSIDFNDNILLDFIDRYPNSPFIDDVLLAIAENSDELSPRYIASLNDFIDSYNPSPIRENLLWMRAINSEVTGNWTITLRSNTDADGSIENCFFSGNCEEETILITSRELYENLIIEFPDGFYAPYARKKLIELPL
jgi:tetratricopeptide (TPR) repeat protein